MIKTISVRQKMPAGLKKGDEVASCTKVHGDREAIWITPDKFTTLFRSQFPNVVGAFLCKECIEEMKREGSIQ